MHRRGLAGGLAGLVAVTLLAACARPIGDGGHSGRGTIVAVSDWHAQLEPLSVTVDGAPRPVAGAAGLAAHFAPERRGNPRGPILGTARGALRAPPPPATPPEGG